MSSAAATHAHAEIEALRPVLDRPRCKCGTKLVQGKSEDRGLCPVCYAEDQAKRATKMKAPPVAETPPAAVAEPKPEAQPKPAKASRFVSKYTIDLGRQIAALAGECGTLAEACRRLGLQPESVSCAIRADKAGFGAEVRKGFPPVADRAELQRRATEARAAQAERVAKIAEERAPVVVPESAEEAEARDAHAAKAVEQILADDKIRDKPSPLSEPPAKTADEEYGFATVPQRVRPLRSFADEDSLRVLRLVEMAADLEVCLASCGEGHGGAPWPLADVLRLSLIHI